MSWFHYHNWVRRICIHDPRVFKSKWTKLQDNILAHSIIRKYLRARNKRARVTRTRGCELKAPSPAVRFYYFFSLPFFLLHIEIPVYDLIPGREEDGGQTHREFLSSPATVVAGRRVVLQAGFSARRRAHRHDARPRVYTRWPYIK